MAGRQAMNKTTLAERLQQQDVAALPDWAAADALNAPDAVNGTARRDVAASDVRGALLASGEWPAIVMVAEGVALPALAGLADADRIALRGLCSLVRDTVSLTQTIQTSVPARYAATVAALEGLVAAGLVSAETHAALLALPDRLRRWAEANGYPAGVTARDVGLARGAIA